MDSKETVRGFRVWRALDQPSSFFGIKGRFMTLFLLIAAGAATVAICLGCSFGSMAGLFIFGALAFCDYMLILSIQAKLSDKAFSRLLSKRRLTGYIKITPESLESHLNRRIQWK